MSGGMFQIGDSVFYLGAWGTESAQPCTITAIGEKNGTLVYDNSLGHWGYAYQYQPQDPNEREVRRLIHEQSQRDRATASWLTA